jgi:hypothetical protein
MLGKKLTHDSKAAVLQQNSEKAVKKFAEIWGCRYLLQLLCTTKCL